MNKSLIASLLSMLVFLNLSATTMKIRIINNTPYKFGRKSVATNPDPGYCNDISNSNSKSHGLIDVWDHLQPGQESVFQLTNSRVLCGLEGYVDWSAYDNKGKLYLVRIDYDIPFIGGNDFVYSCSYPFVMKHLGGGNGNIVDIVFEITGGPPFEATPELPPPPPVILPSSGNKTITGEFIWNPRETGLPVSANEQMQQRNLLTGAFKISVTAPAQLNRNVDGSGPDSYKGTNGYFGNYTILSNAKISIWDARDEQSNQPMNLDPLKSNRIIRFRITGLPDDIPVTVSVNTKNPQWATGEETPPRPGSMPDGRWMVFIHEKERTPGSIRYQVYGAWFASNGGYSSDQKTSFVLSGLFNKSTPIIKGGAVYAKTTLKQQSRATTGPAKIVSPRVSPVKTINKN